MVEDIQANGGILTIEDLKNYKALDSEILRGTFEGNEIYALNLPSYGAITIQILHIMDQLSKANSEELWAKQFDSSTALAYSYRGHQKNSDSLAKILDYNQAERWAKKIEEDKLKLAENTLKSIQ